MKIIIIIIIIITQFSLITGCGFKFVMANFSPIFKLAFRIIGIIHSLQLNTQKICSEIPSVKLAVYFFYVQ